MVQGHCSTVDQRVEVVSRLIAHHGSYGEVTQLSQQIGTSRQTLYAWKGKGQQALEQALTPVRVKGEDEATVRSERAILTLLLEGHASYRGIQACLKELLGLDVSLGTISAIVQLAGQRAQSWLGNKFQRRGVWSPWMSSTAASEAKPTRVLVDAQSGQVWATLPPVAVDGESWTLALWYLHEQGVICTGSVSDGGRAIHEALQTTKAISSHQRDVWHLLHLAGQVQARLERVVQAEEDRQRLIERQERDLATLGRRTAGRPAKTTSREQEQLLMQLHRLRDAACYLFAQLRELLEVVVLTGKKEPHVLGYQARRNEVQTVLDLLEEAIQSVPRRCKKTCNE